MTNPDTYITKWDATRNIPPVEDGGSYYAMFDVQKLAG